MKRFSALLMGIFLLMSTAWAETPEQSEAYLSLSEDGKTAYCDEVAMFVNSCQTIDELEAPDHLDEEDAALLEELHHDFIIAHGSGGFGWTVMDLDSDGIPELIIATDTDLEDYAGLVLEVCTLTDDDLCNPVLFTEIDNRYYWLGGNRFAEIATSDAGDSVITTLEYNGGSLKDLKIEPDLKDVRIFPVAVVFPVV